MGMHKSKCLILGFQEFNCKIYTQSKEKRCVVGLNLHYMVQMSLQYFIIRVVFILYVKVYIYNIQNVHYMSLVCIR